MVAHILPWVALFQVFDGLATCTGGILRARGKQVRPLLICFSGGFELKWMMFFTDDWSDLESQARAFTFFVPPAPVGESGITSRRHGGRAGQND